MITAKATVHEGRILIRTNASGDDFQDAVDKCKLIPGGRWKPAVKAWSYPLAVDVCLAARRVFGDELTVMPRLSEWYVEAARQAEGQTALSAATDAELRLLPTIAPALSATLRPDQRVGAVWVATGHRGAGLVADQPGCGKTLVTIAGIIESGTTGSMLVACPRLSVKAVWFKEITKWTEERVYIARGTRAKRQRSIDRFMADPAERKWLIVVSEMLRVKEAPKADDPTKKEFVGYEYPSLFDTTWAFAIVDESHKMFGSLTVVKGNLAGKGLKRLPCTRRLAVTGTPFGKGGRVQGMFGTLMWLWPDEFTSFWRWADTHFVVEEEDVYIPGGRGRTRTVRNLVGLKSGMDEEQFLHTLGPRILRRTKEEVLPWLPPKQFVEVWCEMSPGQERQYKSMVDDG
ncbi:MAG: SNF2-related protein, partial [Candidatus Nanopelagicales bacterium]